MRTIASFAAVAIAAGIIVPRYASQATVGHAAPALMATQPVAAAQQPTPANDSRSVVVPRNAQGHFQIEGRVDGRRLDFMVDTGASVIALSEEDAASLGIHPSPHDFTAMVRTANGTVRAAPVELGIVEIEDITVHNVSALVLPEGALSQNLLGMSFLSRLHRWEFADGKLVLEQ
jgi:aspartyl protease family protein